MPANGRWDLIRRLKVKLPSHHLSVETGDRHKEVRKVGVPEEARNSHLPSTSQEALSVEPICSVTQVLITAINECVVCLAAVRFLERCALSLSLSLSLCFFLEVHELLFKDQYKFRK